MELIVIVFKIIVLKMSYKLMSINDTIIEDIFFTKISKVNNYNIGDIT